MAHKIKAILFDMDGVLIEARDWHYEALNRALCLFGMDISRDTHLSTFDGLPTRRKLQMLQVSRNLPAQLHGIIGRLKQIYTIETIHSRCRPVFQHRYALSRLKSAGYKTAVCSNSIRQTVNLMMSLAQLEEFIDIQLSNEDVSAPKPDPEIYQLAMARFDVAPHECLIVEDNENGVIAGRASGGHLTVVANTSDVTYARLIDAIQEIERV